MASSTARLRPRSLSAGDRAMAPGGPQSRRHGEQTDRHGFGPACVPRQLDNADRGLLHLGELVPHLRARLTISDALSDAAILDSLKAITDRATPRARWLTAFNSPLGHWLVVHGRDLNTALSLILSLLPQPRS